MKISWPRIVVPILATLLILAALHAIWITLVCLSADRFILHNGLVASQGVSRLPTEVPHNVWEQIVIAHRSVSKMISFPLIVVMSVLALCIGSYVAAASFGKRDGTADRTPGVLFKAVTGIALIYIGVEIVPLFAGRQQWDLRTYYYAAQAHDHGLNPYDTRSLRSVSGLPIRLPFVYPPHTLCLFSPLASIGYGKAYYLFLAAKLIGLAALAAIWCNIAQIRRRDLWIFIPALCLGYDFALLRDLASGNVSLFEQVLVWGGILLMLRGKNLAGGLTLLSSSIFKLSTTLLSPLMVVIGNSKRAFGAWIVAALCFVLACESSYVAWPDLWAGFLSMASLLDERGNVNPSSLALAKDLAGLFGLGGVSASIGYGISAVGVIAVWSVSCWQGRKALDRLPLVYLTLYAYALVAPRMKDYSFVLLLLPTLHVIGALIRGRKTALLAYGLLWIPLLRYQSLFLSLGMFTFLSYWIIKNRNMPDSVPGHVPANAAGQKL